MRKPDCPSENQALIRLYEEYMEIQFYYSFSPTDIPVSELCLQTKMQVTLQIITMIFAVVFCGLINQDLNVLIWSL